MRVDTSSEHIIYSSCGQLLDSILLQSAILALCYALKSAF